MSFFSKLLTVLTLGSMVALPYIASTKGWGIGSERNPTIIQNSEPYCPENPDGNCPKTHRSHFYGRSITGGGPGGGGK